MLGAVLPVLPPKDQPFIAARGNVPMFENWIGREETRDEVIAPARIVEAAAMLGLGSERAVLLARDGAGLPPLFHFFFTNSPGDQAELDRDGHEKLGLFMPPVHEAGAFERRMWAAGDIRFEGSLNVGERLTRRSVITHIEEKQGSTGPLIFVTVARALTGPHGRVDETRVIVYREKPEIGPNTPPPDSQPLPGQADLVEISRWQPDPVQLFRFSALTWNSHRIHYDVDHCRQHEGYPDIITHGPFTALMLAQVAAGTGLASGGLASGRLASGGLKESIAGGMAESRSAMPGARPLRRFRFRGTQPMFAGREVRLHASDDFTRLEARNHEGQQAMKAEAEFG